jgi:AcrR family transcriptional regulator
MPEQNQSTAQRNKPSAQRNGSIDVKGIRRKQITSAVRRIIAAQGLEAVTIANIAAELGTSRGVVVYHFENKEEILHEALTSAMKDAEAAAHRLEDGTLRSVRYADLVAQAAGLVKSSNDWWKIYYAFLSHSHVNPFYRRALAWSDTRYRNSLAKRLGSLERASVILAVMKGLAMQASVDAEFDIDGSIEELRSLLRQWE